MSGAPEYARWNAVRYLGVGNGHGEVDSHSLKAAL
jgi:hypothetical protein